MTRTVIDRAAFLKPAGRRKVDVALPELGNGSVVPVWGMTAREWTVFQSEQQGANGKPNAKAKQVRERLVVACCRDDAGAPLFTAADLPAIGDMPAGVVERIVNAALEVSGITSSDVESLAKNSEETQAA